MLTTKKRGFADALMRGENQTQSAILAGYSAATAKYKGHQLSKDKDVLSYIERMTPDPDDELITDCDSVEMASEGSTVPELVKTEAIDDPLVVMRRIMNDNLFTDPKLSLDAAAKLAPYVSAKVGEGGKKDAKNTAAKQAANSFSAMMPPALVVNNTI